jgi:hypothetical protein
LQIIPLMAWWARRKRTVTLIFSIAVSYLALYSILLWQALKGESIAEPSTGALIALGVWLIVTIGVLIRFERNGYTAGAITLGDHQGRS